MLYAIFLQIICMLQGAHCWHAFSNTAIHCFDLTANAMNPDPIVCEGIEARWIDVPSLQIPPEVGFNLTYELNILDTFYDWAFSKGYFDHLADVTSAAEAKTWCENTECPADARIAGRDNCCIYHVNIHTCPLHLTSDEYCGPWIRQADEFIQSEVLVGPVDQGNWTSYVAGLSETGLTSIIAHFKIASMQLALETKLTVMNETTEHIAMNETTKHIAMNETTVCDDGICKETTSASNSIISGTITYAFGVLILFSLLALL